MKRLIKLFLVAIGSLSLTSCMDLLSRPVRRNSKSSDEETIESIYSRSENEQSSIYSYNPDDCFISATSYDLTANIGEMVTVSYYLLDSEGKEVQISNQSKISYHDNGLDYSYKVTNYYLEIDLSSLSAGKYSYDIALISYKTEKNIYRNFHIQCL